MNITRQENALAQAASRQIHRKPQARRNPLGKICYIYIFCVLVFMDQVYSNMRCRRSGVPQQQNKEHFS